jgi:hypothetical protein
VHYRPGCTLLSVMMVRWRVSLAVTSADQDDWWSGRKCGDVGRCATKPVPAKGALKRLWLHMTLCGDEGAVERRASFEGVDAAATRGKEALWHRCCTGLGGGAAT